jgi:hypothetical protein
MQSTASFEADVPFGLQGVILYEMAMLARPYEADSMQELMKKIVYGPSHCLALSPPPLANNGMVRTVHTAGPRLPGAHQPADLLYALGVPQRKDTSLR